MAVLAPTAATGQTAEAVLDRVLAGGGFQTELPGAPEHLALPEPEPEPEREWEPLSLSEPAEVLLWVLIAAATVLLLVYLLRLAGDRRRADEVVAEDARPGDGAVPAPRLPPSLGEADRLAAAGAFGEAVHLLLLAGLEGLRSSRAAVAAASLTSREVLHRAALPEAASSALAHLVTASELSHFGGRATTAADYRSCRDAYGRLAATMAATG